MLSIAANRIMMMASLALLLGWSSAAMAAKPESEASVVARLYKDFAWQAIASQSDLFGENLAHQPRTTLERYFSPTLAALLVRDAACQVRSQGVCHLEGDLLFDSQDPRVIDLDVQTVASGRVSVAFKDPVTDEQKRIAFHLSQVGGKWKIADISYGNERQRSLLKVLSRKDH
ncbi:DUF3828 domain-containing protein [Massilia violaceinigra]|uniref:DUF3828 domain-containing protein n=1 Tax=Massilia violaceinigra TaxID=2045208 RepID=A0ABY4ADQ7_9BURK|nr:YbjP/YqhG family protein [Massilia violaceinigra]UOD32094.1 DUF3828 domain-containing protein [Massilia violaceinigra]